MTKVEYKEYQERVAEFIGRENIHFYTTTGDEAYFSHYPCECCDMPLGGLRTRLTAVYRPTGETLEFTICTDCEYYLEYGRLDDMTMLEMERN